MLASAGAPDESELLLSVALACGYGGSPFIRGEGNAGYGEGETPPSPLLLGLYTVPEDPPETGVPPMVVSWPLLQLESRVSRNFSGRYESSHSAEPRG